MASLLENLENVVDQVRAALATGEEESYFTAVTSVTESAVKISLLIEGENAGRGMLEAIEAFAYKTGRRKRVPDFIFVATESVGNEQSEQIMISGCSKNYELDLGYIAFGRNERGKIQTGSWSGAASPSKEDSERVPALRAMRGAIAKSKAPWWRL